jgi:hypothetical protein
MELVMPKLDRTNEGRSVSCCPQQNAQTQRAFFPFAAFLAGLLLFACFSFGGGLSFLAVIA